jgi:hypothetical protein
LEQRYFSDDSTQRCGSDMAGWVERDGDCTSVARANRSCVDGMKASAAEKQPQASSSQVGMGMGMGMGIVRINQRDEIENKEACKYEMWRVRWNRI